MRRRSLLMLLLLLVPMLAGCARLGYYAQSVRGQLDLMARREPIAGLLADPATPEPLAARLATVLEMRAFASDALGLPRNKSYRSYADLERNYALWTVFAAPEFSLDPTTWCFPFVGCLSYRGYFSEQAANDFAAGLAAGGSDIYVGGVAAYSTLGKFDDPVLNTMLHGNDIYLAGLLFHELTHQLLYVKGATSFNESFASFVEEEGLRRWLAARDDDASWQDYNTRINRQDEFHALLDEARGRLVALYAEPLELAERRARKAAEIDRLRDNYAALRAGWNGYGGYDLWFEGPLNNAQLASVATYRQFVPAFRVLLEQAGGDLDDFYARVEALGELPTEQREQRLHELLAAARERL